MANILFAKVGLTLPKTIWGSDDLVAGYDDDVRFLVNVSYNNPDDNFYVIGNNRLDKLEPNAKKRLFPHDNVFDTYDLHKIGTHRRELTKLYLTPLEYLDENSVSVDCGIISLGNMLSRNIPEKTKQTDGSWYGSLASAMRAVAPIIHTLNETGVRWVALADDPRSIDQLVDAADLFHNPTIVLSQINDDISAKHIKSYQDDNKMITTDIEVKYAHLESLVVLDEKVNLVDDSWKDRTNNFSIALNGATHKEGLDQSKRYAAGIDNRLPKLRKWILANTDYFGDCEIYGGWGEDVIASDKRFMGIVARSNLYSTMSNWKHSLCIPIKDGWATTKYLECLKSGVSPFITPAYDTEKNTKLQDFYRVDSSADLIGRIEGTREVMHIEELNKAITSCLSDEFTSGQYLNDEIYKHLGVERNITNVNRELWEVVLGSGTKGLSDFFV